MPCLRVICSALLLWLCAPLLAEPQASHTAEAKRFLELTRVDHMTVPAYSQVQQMFAQRFAQAGGKPEQKPILERYQAQANAALDRVVGWDLLGPDLVALYSDAFTEAELKQLVAFYQTPLGSKLLQQIPQLIAISAQRTQERLQAAVPEVNRLLGQMAIELKPVKQ